MKSNVKELKNRREDLLNKLNEAKHYRNKLFSFVEILKQQLNNKEISLEEFNSKVGKSLKGRTVEEWLSYYDDIISNYNEELHKLKSQIQNSESDKLSVITYIVLFILMASTITTLILNNSEQLRLVYEPIGRRVGLGAQEVTEPIIKEPAPIESNISNLSDAGEEILEPIPPIVINISNESVKIEEPLEIEEISKVKNSEFGSPSIIITASGERYAPTINIYNFTFPNGQENTIYNRSADTALAQPPAASAAHNGKNVTVNNCYDNLRMSDNKVCTVVSGLYNGDPWLRFNFTITEPISWITSIRIRMEANASSSARGEDVAFILYNNTARAWQRFGTDTKAEVTRQITLTNSRAISAVIGPNNQLRLLAEGINLDVGESFGVDYVEVIINATEPPPLTYNDVQRGTLQLSSGEISKSVNVASVSNNSAILFYSSTGSSVNPQSGHVTGILDKEDTITFSRVGTGEVMDISWYLANLSGINVQRGKVSSTGTMQINVNINKINTTGAYLIFTQSEPGTIFNADDWITGKIVNETRISFQMSSVASSLNGPISWQIVNATNGNFRVQRGDITMGLGITNFSIGLPTNINISKSFLLFSLREETADSYLGGAVSVAGYISNYTSLQFNRSQDSTSLVLSWQVIEFADSTNVQQGVATLLPNILQQDIPINKINQNSTAALLTGWMKAGSSNLTSTGGNDDNVGVSWYTAILNETGLQLNKKAYGLSSVGYSVISFNTTFPLFATFSNNVPPVFTNAFINTTDVNKNDTDVNLTIDWINGNGSIIANVTSNWYEDNNSIIRAALTFDLNHEDNDGYIYDYSGYHNPTNGGITPGSSFKWINNDCKIGGCYNRTNDFSAAYINSTNTKGLPTGNVPKSITSWFKHNDKSGVCRVAGQSGAVLGGFGNFATGQNFQIELCETSTNPIKILGWGASFDWNTGVNGASYADGKWHHAAVTYNASTTKLYIDGKEKASTTAYTFNTETNRIMIGQEIDGSGRAFDGQIDEFLIWNRSLSKNQILQLYEDGIANVSTKVLVGDETSIGKTYKAQLVVTDGINNSAFINTSEVLILSTTVNNNPTIDSVTLDTADDVNILEGGNRTLWFSFISTDLDGASNLDNTKASANISRTGETTRIASCTFANDIGVNSRNYSCNTNIVFYDGAGAWNINTYIEDVNGASVQSNLDTFVITETTAIVLDSGVISFPQVSSNQYNISSLSLIGINNTGNKDISNLRVSAKTLVSSSGTTFIPASNFSIGTDYSGTNACNVALTTTTRLANLTIPAGYANFTGSINGASVPAQAIGNKETLGLCLIHAPSNLISTTYSAAGGSAWIFIA